MSTTQETQIQVTNRTPQDWLIRVKDGINFTNAVPLKRFDFKIRTKNGNQLNKVFRDEARSGDRLWFILHKSRGEIIGMATFERWSYRSWIEDLTDAEIGYENPEHDEWAATMHYTDLYDFRGRPENRKFITRISHIPTIVLVRQTTNCAINLPLLYENIMMYGNIHKW